MIQTLLSRVMPAAACAFLLALSTAPMPAVAAPDPAETQRLHALFDRAWDISARQRPEWATFRGDHRFDDRLSDASPAAIAEHDATERQWLAEARAIRRDALSATDALSLDLFIERQESAVARQAFDGWRRQSLGSQGGFQSGLAGLMRQMPAHRPERAEQVIARLKAYPRRVEQEIERVRGAIAMGWVTSRPVLERSLQQLDGQIALAPRQGPYFEPLHALPDDAPGRAALLERAEAVIVEQVLPAQRALRRFIADELLPRAPAAGGLSSYPGGDRVYAQLVKDHTTTTLTPQQVHDIGLRELARLRAEMAAVQREMKFDGSFKQFVAHLRSPGYHYASPAEMLEGYRAVAKRLDPEMTRLFAELPRIPYGIRPMPAFLGPGAADNYNAPPPDGSQPGWYNANIQAFQRRPRWALPTLVAHETVPGHHLQSARAREVKGLPAFRQQGRYTAYSEGWALYAETLGLEIGLYDTPETHFGHLQAQAMRAARLVVDTGLHALGWPRQRAIDFLVDEVGESAVFAGSEVDRYLSNPGQALAYMIGRLKFGELRERAQLALGARFDLRRFHNVVLDDGPLPLTVLDRRVDDWIRSQRAG